MITDTLTNQKIEFRAIDKSEPEWLYDLRKQAWDRYQRTNLPLRVMNIWKYTKPEWFLPDNVQNRMNVLPLVSHVKEDEIAPLRPEFAAFGSNHAGGIANTQIADDLKSSGLIYLDLISAIRKHGGLVQNYLGKLVGYDFGKFEALNMALWNNGMFLYIPDNLILEKPVYIHRHPDEKYNMSRVLAIIGNNSKATIIDEYSGEPTDNPYNANCTVEIFGGQNSEVRYVSAQNINQKSRSYVTQRAQVGRDAQYYSIFVSLGADVSKYNLGAILDGKGANSRMLGVLFGDKKQHFDHHTMHHHKAGESYSNINFKVVLRDKALSAYTGLIRIDEKTPNCEAYQENRNLLLNPGTRAESIPELEILNDEVRCSHGATVGPIDPEMVFYLKSRGCSEEEAVRTIVSGFIEPLLVQIPEDLRRMMKNMIEFKLGNGTVN